LETFTEEKCNIAVHGHCYQKVLSSQQFLNTMLSLPKNYVVQIIPSGCCVMLVLLDMKEHYQISQKVGELVLFPLSGTFLRKQLLLHQELPADIK
jgi:predicted amino acid racemase